MRWKAIQDYSLQLTSGLIIIASLLMLIALDTNLDTNAQNTSALEREVESIQGRINDINASLEDVSQLKNSFSEEVARVEAEIAETDQLITDTNNAIESLEAEITQNEIDIANLIEDITVLTKQIQKNNHVSPLQNLLSSRDVGEAIGKMFTLSNTQADLDEKRQELEDLNTQQKANLETQQTLKEQLEATRAILEGKKQSLDELIATYQGRESEYARQIANLKAQEEETQNQIQALEAEAERAREEAAQRQRQQQNTGGGSSGGGSGGGASSSPGSNPGSFGPLGCWFEYTGGINFPAGYFIRPAAGWGRGFSCSHDAVDLTTSFGSSVVASAPGTVTRVSGGCSGSFSWGCGSGYGNHIVIRHNYNGETLYTLYAHLASLNISSGQTVSRGQQIGTVGSSGNSTGAHVHFMMMPGATYGGNNCRNGGSSRCLRPERFIAF
jgi:murein DD-endopeptidase MepM/ murein hydrolase activator NlpD